MIYWKLNYNLIKFNTFKIKIKNKIQNNVEIKFKNNIVSFYIYDKMGFGNLLEISLNETTFDDIYNYIVYNKDQKHYLSI
jgi:hypothetical protein